MLGDEQRNRWLVKMLEYPVCFSWLFVSDFTETVVILVVFVCLDKTGSLVWIQIYDFQLMTKLHCKIWTKK